MKSSRIAGSLAVIVLAGGLSACGASSSTNSSTTSASGLSRSALAARANTICAIAQAQARAVKAPSASTIASDATVAAAYFDKIFPISDSETKELQALAPAADAAGDWRSFVGAQVSADQLLLTLKKKAHAKDPSGLRDLKQVQPAGQKVAAAAKKIGATTCAA